MVAVTVPNCPLAAALPIVAALTALAVSKPVNVVVAPLNAAPALPMVAAFTVVAVTVPNCPLAAALPMVAAWTVLAVNPLAAFNDVNEPVLAVVDPTGVF